jgi:hypothetical protein
MTPSLCDPLVDPEPFIGNLGEARNPCKIVEADARTRTADPFITSEVLYQLSYVGGVDSKGY